MSKHKKNEANDSDDLQQVKLLGSTTIQDADGDAYLITLGAHSTKTPRYTVDIRRKDNGSDCVFGVGPYSLQKLTAQFANAVLHISKSEAAKNIRIQNATGRAAIEFALRADPTEIQRYELNINVPGPSGDGILILIDLYGLQELAAWFAQAIVRVSTYEADHPNS